MIQETDEDCLQSIVTAIARSKKWRSSLQIRYGDPRIERAAEALGRIESEAKSLTAAQWEELRSHYGWASQQWHDALSLATRNVGFRAYVRTFDAFVEHLISVLNQTRAAA